MSVVNDKECKYCGELYTREELTAIGWQCVVCDTTTFIDVIPEEPEEEDPNDAVY